MFNIEVRRLPADPSRLPDIICEKVRQLPPSAINLLWLSADASHSEAHLQAAVGQLHTAAKGKDDAYFRKRSLSSAAEFSKGYLRLSGVLLHRPDNPVIWLNPQARHVATRDLLSALRQLN